VTRFRIGQNQSSAGTTGFPVNCDVEQLLYGDWTDKEMVVHFGSCSNLPDAPIRARQRMIVFANVAGATDATAWMSEDISSALT
jgi:hypothetical protein